MKNNKVYYGVLIFLIIAICAGGAALVYYIGSYLAIQPVLDQTEITGLTDFIKYFETAQYSQWMFWQLAGASASLVALIALTVVWSKVAKEE